MSTHRVYYLLPDISSHWVYHPNRYIISLDISLFSEHVISLGILFTTGNVITCASHHLLSISSLIYLITHRVYHHLRISSPTKHFIPPGMLLSTGHVITCICHSLLSMSSYRTCCPMSSPIHLITHRTYHPSGHVIPKQAYHHPSDMSSPTKHIITYRACHLTSISSYRICHHQAGISFLTGYFITYWAYDPSGHVIPEGISSPTEYIIPSGISSYQIYQIKPGWWWYLVLPN